MFAYFLQSSAAGQVNQTKELVITLPANKRSTNGYAAVFSFPGHHLPSFRTPFGPRTPAWEPQGLSHPSLQAPCYYCLTRERAICKIKVAYCLGLSRYVGWYIQAGWVLTWSWNERVLPAVVLLCFPPGELRLVGCRMLEVLADKGARRARREKGERTRKEGRKARGAF